VATSQIVSAAGAAARPLLERDAELAALQALLGASAGADGRLAVIEGRAGIGKTRLLLEVRNLARAARFEVLSARAGEFEGQFAFGIVRQLFEPALAMAGAEARAELLSGAAELAGSLFSSAPAEVAAGDAEASFATLHGLYWLAANFALRQPTLLVVDDLHWADAPSLRWLAYLARRLDGLALLLVGASRPLAQAREPGLLTELLSDPLAVVIHPVALGLPSTAAIARWALGVEPDETFARALQEGSGGNPLYLGALLDAVARDGVSPTAEGAHRVLELGPQAVARAVALGLGRLPPGPGKLARAAAILGDGSLLRDAAALAELDTATALDAGQLLVQSDLLRSADPIEFVHPVVRSAVYQTLSPSDLSAGHLRAARILLDGGALAERAAAHILNTIPGSDPFVTSTLRDAAKRSLSQGAADSAVTYLHRALEECSPAETPAVLWELGVAERLVDDTASIEHLYRAQSLSTDPRQRAAISLPLSQVLWVAARTEESIGVAQAALANLGDSDADLKEQFTANLLAGAIWDPEHFDAAAALLAEVDGSRVSDGVGGDCLLGFAAEWEMRRGEDRTRAVELAGRAVASGRLARERQFALVCAALALMAAGESDAAAFACEAGLREARRSGDLFRTATFSDLSSFVALERGDLRYTEQYGAEALALERANDIPTMLPYAASWSIEAAIDQGRLDDARCLLEDLGPIDEAGVTPHAIFAFQARGKLRFAEQRVEEALEDFLALGQLARSIGVANPAYRPWRSHAALALHRLGRADEARGYSSEELVLARRWGAPRAIGISLRALGLIDGGAAGEELLREAVAVLAPSSARLEHARALIGLGAALRRANQRKDARQHLRDGVDLAHQCGAAALVAMGNEELAATGAHPRTLMLSGLESLTVSERRVAQMAAAELSNKEIAQTLFVTVKTVEVHLSRVYRKLDVDSRRQLADALEAPARD
jgi:DNA-binding CsgD family transcriptional regulator